MAEQIDIDIVAHDKTSSVLQGIFQGIGQSLANFALQIPGAIVNFGASMVKEAADAELAIADLRATLQSTAGAAGMTEKELTDMAASLSKVTRFSDDAILSGQNMLLTFTNIGEDVFPDATKSLLDLATKMKSDLPTAAIQLGKALNDPIGGIDALRRVGVQFTDEQKNVVEALVKTGDIAGAQRVILEELNKEFGGQAEAAGGTFAGQMDILNNRFSEMKETIGTALLPVLTELMDKVIMPIIPYIEAAAQAFADWLASASPFAERIANIAAVIWDYLQPAFQAISDWWAANGGNIMFQAQMLWDNLWVGMNQTADWIITNLIPVFQSLYAWWQENSPAITAAAWEIWGAIKDGAIELWENYLRPFIEENLPKLSAWWEENSPLMLDLLEQFKNGFIEKIPVIVEVIGGLVDVLAGMLDLILEVVQITLQVLTGDWAGAWETAQEIAITVTETIGTAIYNLAGILVETLGFKRNNPLEIWTENWYQFLRIVDGIAAQIEERVNAMIETLKNTIQGATFGASGGGSLGDALSGALVGSGGNIGGALSGGLFGGMRAGGGAVSSGGSYLVGEQGAEMFVPNTSGQIIPNGAGGSNISITLNYSPSVALGNRQEAEQTLLPYILQGIRAAQANGYVATA